MNRVTSDELRVTGAARAHHSLLITHYLFNEETQRHRDTEGFSTQRKAEDDREKQSRRGERQHSLLITHNSSLFPTLRTLRVLSTLRTLNSGRKDTAPLHPYTPAPLSKE